MDAQEYLFASYGELWSFEYGEDRSCRCQTARYSVSRLSGWTVRVSDHLGDPGTHPGWYIASDTTQTPIPPCSISTERYWKYW